MSNQSDGCQEHLPILPLPSTVLFPGALVPLHIRDPRDRQLTADALAGERLVGLALLRPGWQKRSGEFPSVYSVIGIGSIVWHEAFEDGRYQLIVEGVARARIERSQRLRPYRMASVRWQTEKDATYYGADHDRRLLMSFVRLLSVDVLSADALAEENSVESMSLRELADHVASRLDTDAHDKQRILGEAALARRVQRLLLVLQRLTIGGPQSLRRASRSLSGPECN